MGQALTASEAEEFMREADLNGDGKLDYDEFARIMSQSISKPRRDFEGDKCICVHTVWGARLSKRFHLRRPVGSRGHWFVLQLPYCRV